MYVRMFAHGIVFQSYIKSKDLLQKGLLEMNDNDWDALTEETFKKVFSGSSPVKRAKFSGLKRNIDFLK